MTALSPPQPPTPAIEARLMAERNIWLSTASPGGPPHLVPIWFIWLQNAAWICTAPNSVKARNMTADARVMFALEDGDRPALARAVASRVAPPFPAPLVEAFQSKYGWNIETDAAFGAVYTLRVSRWLSWNTGSTA